MNAFAGHKHPCQGPGPAWGHCGNDGTWAVTRRDGTRGTGYMCDTHKEAWRPFKGHEDDLIFTRLSPEVAP